jgi:hypothetical protein
MSGMGGSYKCVYPVDEERLSQTDEAYGARTPAQHAALLREHLLSAGYSFFTRSDTVLLFVTSSSERPSLPIEQRGFPWTIMTNRLLALQ